MNPWIHELKSLKQAVARGDWSGCRAHLLALLFIVRHPGRSWQRSDEPQLAEMICFVACYVLGVADSSVEKGGRELLAAVRKPVVHSGLFR